MAGPALQLFPPPRAPRLPSPQRRPSQPKIATPDPVPTESATSTRPPADFHELVIQVNSVPVTPSNPMAPPPAIASPPRAHVSTHQQRAATPTGRPHFSPPPQHTSSPHLDRQESFYREQTNDKQHMSSPDPNRAVSPAFSEAQTLVRANSSATRVRSTSPVEEIPMRSMFPIYDPTVPLSRQPYQPTQASPTQLPRAQISRSPYSESYVPHNNLGFTASSAPPPAKPFFTPSNLLDNLWLATNGQEEPDVQLYTLRMHRATAANPTITFGTTPSLPFYSMAQSNLAGDYEIPSILNELLIQRHHPTQPRVLPIAQLDIIAPPSLSLDNGSFNPDQQNETALLTTIYPKLAALQALDAAANSPAASRLALSDPGAQSPAAQRLAEDVLAGTAQRECCALVWNRDDPQQQANPWAQHMPSEGLYQLHHPTLGTFPISIEGDCSVINQPSTRPITAFYGHNMPLAPQTTGRKPACITVLNPYVLSPTTPRTNAFSPLPPPPRLDGTNRPTSMTPSVMSVTQLPTNPDATADDAMLARLDFTNDALTLNLGALTRFGNPFLVDVVASTLLAVAIAEATRGRKARNRSQDNFDPPPPSFTLTHQKEDTAKAFKDSFVEGFQGMGGKSVRPPLSGKSLRAFANSFRSSSTTAARAASSTGDSPRSKERSFDKDIELGEWYGQDKKVGFGDPCVKEEKQKRKTKTKSTTSNNGEEEVKDKLPFVARSLIAVITLLFKTVVWVVKIMFRIVTGVVVMLSRNASKL
ncbi:conserved proline-rich [Pyrenophora seminiperda CCB06]|uniref:Conserved proline-rich n=1 Tax=Pyrenophora seminiperda CCB06 TaxID=1302712 RepID=A0A3M7MES7_9PLEO|nr:conserved proline-rich [Pyrenophora seminiperda CCB06]